jgi:hypothetical protein
MSDHHHHHKKKHHVKISKWINGILEAIEHEFESLEDALTFTNNKKHHHEKEKAEKPQASISHSVKIYNADGECVHSADSTSDTYA